MPKDAMRLSKRLEHVSYGVDEAFKERVTKDYAMLLDTVDLATTERARQLLLMQSEQGRAIMGGGAFTEKNGHTSHVYRYVNTTIEHVLASLAGRKGLRGIKEERQHIIDGINWWVNVAITEITKREHGNFNGYERSCMLLDENQEPLAGIEYFRHNPVSNPLVILQGMYLGSCMDNFAWRERMRARYGLAIGGGESYPIHMPTLDGIAELKRSNGEGVRYSLELLAQAEHSDAMIDQLLEQGVISVENEVPSDDGWMQGYVRRRIGCGVSDDAALLTAGIMLGDTVEERIGAALGVLLIDAVDTWDKCTPVIYSRGQDELLGERIRKMLGKRLCLGTPEQIDDTVLKFIYAAAIDPKKKTLYPDCSQRRFLEFHKHKRFLYALSAHIHYLKTFDPSNPTKARANLPDLSISFKGVSLQRFMHEYIHRLQDLELLSRNGKG